MTRILNLKTALAVAALGLAGAMAPTGSALAGEGAWCADQGGRYASYTNCGYYTFRQCLAAVSGVGGFCKPNPRVLTYAVEDEHGTRLYRKVYR